MRIQLPKFVIAGTLFVASLSACTMPKEPAKTNGVRQAAGVNSKMGKTLSQSEMCALPVIDSQGRTTVASLRFQNNAVIVRRSRVMDANSLFSIEKETSSGWSLFGDSLLLTENGSTVKNPIEVFERESDKATCVRFIALEERPEYCACEFN